MFEPNDHLNPIKSRRGVLVLIWLSSAFDTASGGCMSQSAPMALGGEAELASYLNMSSLLNFGAPTSTFRDNLRGDVKYITSWPANGWTNQVIEYMNLLYMGLITERVAIIPQFTPMHLKDGAPYLAFGEDPDSELVEDLGCWDVQNVMWQTSGLYLEPPPYLKLDISYTTPPDWVYLPHDGGEPHMAMWPLASLAFPSKRKDLNTPELSPLHKVSLPPDEQLLCYDSLYYTGVQTILEYAEDFSPAWRFVGQYMHWAPKLQELADNYTRQTLGIEPHEAIPPYAAVHIRRGDFKIWCDGVPVEECFAPLSAFVRRVEEVKAEIFANRGIIVDRVIVTSDERDSEWWAAYHSKTVELYGQWYPILIDAAIQSFALCFVGTDRSTVSVLSQRRVSSWQNGTSAMVLWGKLGSDDH
ncbi:hypothetical protein C8J57DRAFT_1219811 [Mycena rebaudengoi]|nr:hypothetical protein C8J57DRAFT_1219811 [Mycena rebaudengoi]